MYRIHGGTIVCWRAAAVGAAGCGGGACVGDVRVVGGGVSCVVLGSSSRWSVVVVPGGWSWAWRSPTPDRPSFAACGRGPLPTGCGCGGCGRGDPSPTPQRALLRAGFARCAGGTRAPRGAASCLAVGRQGWGALPPRPLVLSGVRPGPTTHWLWVWGVRAWGPVTNSTARALASWLCALWGRPKGAWGGGASCLGVGRPELGALPTPTTRPFGRAAGAHYPLAVGAGGAGMGICHQPHRARSWELALRAVGVA